MAGTIVFGVLSPVHSSPYNYFLIALCVASLPVICLSIDLLGRVFRYSRSLLSESVNPTSVDRRLAASAARSWMWAVIYSGMIWASIGLYYMSALLKGPQGSAERELALAVEHHPRAGAGKFEPPIA